LTAVALINTGRDIIRCVHGLVSQHTEEGDYLVQYISWDTRIYALISYESTNLCKSTHDNTICLNVHKGTMASHMFKLHNGYEYFVLYLINKNNNIESFLFYFRYYTDVYLFSILYNFMHAELNSVC
jgi:hypothetical protein